MSSGIVSTATGFVRSFGRLLGASFKASGKAMDGLSARLRAYAEDQPVKPEPPVTPNPE
ncbi:MAG: hypothetical protein LBU05_05025 [Bifidobacteriaceae bacterium]|jgi:hypothetical protein|nr:hypothetical protein [Bifidobacteriaceae bacterium]